jgi:hypothetical protein
MSLHCSDVLVPRHLREPAGCVLIALIAVQDVPNLRPLGDKTSELTEWHTGSRHSQFVFFGLEFGTCPSKTNAVVFGCSQPHALAQASDIIFDVGDGVL